MTFIPSVLSKTDSNNSSNIVINNGQVFTGTYTETTGYNSLIITILSDKDGDIQLYFSDDGTNISFTYNYTYYANQQYINNLETIKKYYKIKFTNSSGSNQTSFSLYTRLSTSNVSDLISNNFINNDVESNPTLDAFGKLRISSPFTLLDIKFRFFK